MTDLPPPPKELDWLARVVGAEALLALIEWRGGTRVTIPASPTAQSPIAQAIGLEAAEKMGREFPRVEIKLPLAKQWRVRVYRARGMSAAKICLRLGISESSVWEMLNRPDSSRQLSLL